MKKDPFTLLFMVHLVEKGVKAWILRWHTTSIWLYTVINI